MKNLVEQQLYYPNGACKARFFTKEGKLHGPSIFYAPSGAILVMSEYVEGRQEGEACFFTISGEREKIERYRDGCKHGLQEAWYEDQTLRSRMYFDAGALHGPVELFWASGKPKRTCAYVRHQKEGWDRIWDVHGRLLFEGEYVTNQPVGLHCYFVDGVLRKEWEYSKERCKKRVWNAYGVLISEEGASCAMVWKR
jgi:antitoxin component YwqK of YwqJK toxin-antitoxin module